MQTIFCLAERIDGLDTAIILVAKREGSSWTYKNIIESALLPMIIKNEHPCVYSAFALLGMLFSHLLYYIFDERILMYSIDVILCIYRKAFARVPVTR